MKAEAITSAKNPVVKDIRKALAKGGLTDQGFAVAEGFHLLDEAIRSRCPVPVVVTSESVKAAVNSRVHGLDGTLYDVPDALFKDLASTEAPQGVLALVHLHSWTLDQVLAGQGIVVILDGLQEPGNAGAIVRAAEAFEAAGIIHLKGSVNLYNPKAMRASAGSIFRVPLAASQDHTPSIEALERRGITLFAAVPSSGIDLASASLAGPAAVVIGSEGRGVSAAFSQKATGLRIPTAGVESLNAAMAAGIILYEARRQRMQLK